MLVLSRKEEESILIGPDIEVQITKIDGNTVRLGIIAPRSVGIYRKEIVKDISRSNQESALSHADSHHQIKIARELFMK